MDRIEAVKQAFVEASRGYREARDEILDATDYPDNFSLSTLAPVAAEIYRQLTGRLIVECGSDTRKASKGDLETIKESLERSGIETQIVAAHDVKFRELDNEQIIRIIVEAPGGEVTDGK